MTVPWKPVPIFAGLLLLLTYFLLQSDSPDLALRARMSQALDAFELHDTALDRDVLLVRAGLLTDYDSLTIASRDVLRAITDLQRGIQTASAEAARLLGPQADALAEAARQKKLGWQTQLDQAFFQGLQIGVWILPKPSAQHPGPAALFPAGAHDPPLPEIGGGQFFRRKAVSLTGHCRRQARGAAHHQAGRRVLLASRPAELMAQAPE